MSAEQLYEELVEAVALGSGRGLVRLVTTYQPAGGSGSRVYPPTYPTSRDNPDPYLLEERFVDGEVKRAVVLDAVPSQANRCEEALLAAHRVGRTSIPLMELRHKGETEVVLTSLEFPHRYADAYLRDSRLDGVAFDSSQLGRKLLAASHEDAAPLYAQDPGSLVFGAWNSHRKGRQQKFPRAYVSEVVGWDPVLGKRNAGRLDPINLQGATKPAPGELWDFVAAAEKVKGAKLSEIGHGNIAPNPQHGGVTISSATRTATLSLSVLDRIGFGQASAGAAVKARAVLAAYALLADRLAFGGPALWLRSGCELVPTEERLEWVGRAGATPFELSVDDALGLFSIASAKASEAGLPLSTETVTLEPAPALAKAIDFALTKAESAED